MKRDSLRVLMLVTVLAFVLSISASTPVSASPQKVVVYTSTATDDSVPMFEAFTAATGIEVEYVYAGTGEIWARTGAEAANPLGDVLWSGSIDMVRASEEMEEGLFAVYESPEDVHFSVMDPNHVWHAVGVPKGVQSFGLNTLLMPDSEDWPTSYRDFADIKYDGKLILLNPNYSGTGYITAQLFIHLAESQWGYASGWDFLRKVMMNARIGVSSGGARNAVLDGEIAMSVFCEMDAAEAIKEGYPFVLLPMEEGYFGGIDMICIIKNCPHPDEAEAFIDWFLSAEGQQLLADVKGDRPARAGITMHPDLYTYGFGDEYTHIVIPYSLFCGENARGLKEFNKTWNSVMGEAVVLKSTRNAAYGAIEAAETSIEIAEAEGRTEGLEDAKAKLADAEAAFAGAITGSDYEGAKALADEALELSGGAAATAPIVIYAVIAILAILVIVLLLKKYI